MNGCVATNIRAMIAAKGMVQKVVAERAGFSEQQFCDMLNGRKIIRAEHMPAIAKALGVEFNDLFAVSPFLEANDPLNQYQKGV